MLFLLWFILTRHQYHRLYRVLRRNGPNFGRVFLMLNYTDNGQIKLWTSFGSTKDSCQLVSLIYICSPVRHTNSADARLKCISLHILQGTRCVFVVSVWYTELQAGSQTNRVTSPLSIPVWCIVLRTLCITITRVRGTLQFKLMALCHSQVTLMLSIDSNITETTYSCQFQYVFGNQ